MKWTRNQVDITCETNLRGVDTYNLISPYGTTSIQCVDDVCRKIINNPKSGDYQCELKLDGYSITSPKQPISDISEIPPTAPEKTVPPAHTANITTIGLGTVGGLLLVVLIISTTIFSITIRILRRQIQNGYQLVPNNDPGKIQVHTV